VTALFVGLLTALPIGACALVGTRWGGRRLACRGGGLFLAGVFGAAVVAAGFRAAWYRPLGLLTPVAAAAVGFVVAWYLFARYLPKILRIDRTAPVGKKDRVVGAMVGAAAGVIVAGSLWIAATLAEGVAASPSPEAAQAQEMEAPASRSWAHALVKTANQGFVRHLPILGPLGDEVEAVTFILNSSPLARRRVANERDWQRLTRLSSYRDLGEDPEVDREIEALRRGNVFAIYRLQRNPRVVAFLEEEEVQALLPGLRPSVLAQEIEALEHKIADAGD